jgi:DNA gyrase inhibitor GyrI
MEVDFGVEVTRSFERSGEVHETDTPAGEAAVATHVGAYESLSETHNAVHAWAAENSRNSQDIPWKSMARSKQVEDHGHISHKLA